MQQNDRLSDGQANRDRPVLALRRRRPVRFDTAGHGGRGDVARAGGDAASSVCQAIGGWEGSLLTVSFSGGKRKSVALCVGALYLCLHKITWASGAFSPNCVCRKSIAVGETVFLLNSPLPFKEAVSISTGMQMGRQQNDSLTDGYNGFSAQSEKGGLGRAAS